MLTKMINIGFGNSVCSDKVIAVILPDSAPVKRLKETAKTTGKLIDATSGRRTRSIIVTNSDHIILSGVQAETITTRFNGNK